MYQQILLLTRAGRFLDASRLVEHQSLPTPDVTTLRVEIDYFLGYLDAAEQGAQQLLKTATLGAVLRCRCTTILAAVRWDKGDLAESLALTTKAFVFAQEAGDLALACKTAVCLLERKCNTDGFSSSLPIAAHARRYALRSGDPQGLALLHLVHGRLEARAGRLELSRRHFKNCRRFLEQDENIWISAATYLDESGVLSLNGDLTGAVDYAQQGFILAEQSGWSKGIVAGAANLAFLHLRGGAAEEATRQLEVASRQTFSSASFECALAETAANAAIATGQYAKAEALLRGCHQPSSRVPIWYTLKAAETLVRLFWKLIGQSRLLCWPRIVSTPL